MTLNLLFQIFISWCTACCILTLFYKIIAVTEKEIYCEPTLLTSLLASVGIDFPLKAKFIASRIIYHSMGICFAAIYYLVWYYEFAEISWTTSVAIGLISGLLRIISWTFLIIVIPSAYLNNFKGYYLQLVFLHNIFTIIALTLYELF